MTGATGFVGSHLLDLLAEEQWRVRATVRPSSDTSRLERHGAEVVVTSLHDERALRHAVRDCDVVFHLAAATRARTEADYERVNVDATRALMRAVQAEGGRRVVYLSSLAAAGPAVDGRPVSESDTPRPVTAYGRTKLAGERICLDSAEALALRPPAVYGPRDRDLLTFFRFARLGLMPVPSGPDRPVQMVHVRDLARATLLAARAPVRHGVYNVAEAAIHAWSEVVAMIEAAVGRRARRITVPRAAVRAAAALAEAGAALVGGATIFNRDKARELLAPGWLCDTDRAERDLGFEARIPLRKGIEETAQWYARRGWLNGRR